MENAKAYKGLGMEGFVARWYTNNTHKAMEDFKALARRVAGQLQPGSAVLEIAPGPGFFAVELAKLGWYRIIGLDISKTFVEIARKNAAEAKVDVDFEEGNASRMPFESGRFDFLLCRAAFKNFAEPVAAVQEMCRVLKPGGRGLLIDLRRDTNRAAVSRAVEEMRLGWFDTILTKLAFRFMLIKRAYTKSEFEQFFAQAQFRSVRIDEDAMGLEIWMDK